MSVFWLFLFVALLFLEAANPATFFWIFFGLAALATFVLSVVCSQILLQILFFLGLSVFFSVFFIRNVQKKKTEPAFTNADRLIGDVLYTTGTVFPITEGKVTYQKISGTSWALVSEKGEIPKGTRCEIAQIRGNRLVIRKK